MLTLLVVGALLLAGLVVGGLVALVGFIIHAALWLVLLPLRILFKLIFGVGFGLLGLVFGPVLLLIAAVAVIGGIVAAIIAALAPLFPVLVIGLMVWMLFKLFSRRPSPV